ncbi:MAG: ABC transporter ATP-binding protein [Proteobacteria bacterium]|nr:ABC transporter ATP-binding protein [Pseudomonadota bacterium]
MGQLQLKSICKRFGEIEVLKDIALDIAHGEFVVFVGPSGCGKSTLLRSIAGLEEISSGEMLIDGVKVNDMPPVKRGIAMVFQSYALYPHMTVFENIAFPLRVEKLPQAQVQAKVEAAAAILHLSARLHQKPGTLSGGQRQRVAIGRAIVREPKIFLFDEPLSNLDAALRTDMRFELLKLHQSLGATMIYVTHDQIEAMTMADKIVVMNAGIVEQIGAPIELYTRPVNRFVAGFIGSPKMNFLKGTCLAVSEHDVSVDVALAGKVTLPIVVPKSLVGAEVELGIRPEHLKIGAEGHVMSMKPSLVERLGINTVVHQSLDEEGGNFTGQFTGDHDFVLERPFDVGFDPARAMLFDKQGIRLG